jgi:hypothetical protein
MIIVREPYLIDLLTLLLVLPPDEIEQVEALSGVTFEHQGLAARLWLSTELKWAGIDETGPLVVGGYVRTRPGVFQSWYIPHPRVWEDKEIGRTITRMTRKIIKGMITSGTAHRLETVVLSSRTRAQAWYPMIGLKYESALPGYGAKGEDFAMYVALRENE